MIIDGIQIVNKDYSDFIPTPEYIIYHLTVEGEPRFSEYGSLEYLVSIMKIFGDIDTAIADKFNGTYYFYRKNEQNFNIKYYISIPSKDHIVNTLSKQIRGEDLTERQIKLIVGLFKMFGLYNDRLSVLAYGPENYKRLLYLINLDPFRRSIYLSKYKYVAGL